MWRSGERLFSALALNDVVVGRGAFASMVELRVEVDGNFVANQRADGLIIATPMAGLRGLRVGWLGDLQGHLAMEDGLLPVCAQALGRMEAHGALVEPTPLGFSADALWQAWLVWRRALVGPKVAALLAQPGLSMEQIAEQLGYSEVGNFIRAFRRWTGRTPARWRREPSVAAPAPPEAAPPVPEPPRTG